MTRFPFFRSALLLAALPAVLAAASCSKDDNKPAPQQGRILFSHNAAAANVKVKALIKGAEVGQLDYGQNSAYVGTNADTATVRISEASSDRGVAKTSFTIEGNKNYSVFAYSPSAAFGSAALLSVEDDLTAPPANQAKVRLVHLAVNAPTPVRLNVPSSLPNGAGTDVTNDVAFGKASDFVAINSGPQTLVVTSNGTPRQQVIAVGDGKGGTTPKNFESGKIYTIVVSGIAGPAVSTAQQPRISIIQNN